MEGELVFHGLSVVGAWIIVFPVVASNFQPNDAVLGVEVPQAAIGYNTKAPLALA